MDALKFLKFWRNATARNTSSAVSHLAEETDNGSCEDDSFFDLELTVHDFDYKESNTTNKKTDGNPEEKTKGESKGIGKKGMRGDDSEVNVSKTALSLSSNEPISKRKVLPIEPISKPQSPITLLKSAQSFSIFMFKKPKGIMAAQKTEQIVKAESSMGRNQKQQTKEAKVFAEKLIIEEPPHYSPSLCRNNSSTVYGTKLRNQSSEESKSERFSKDVLQKYLNMIKPLYVKVSRSYSEKMKLSGEPLSASPTSSPSVACASSKKEKQGNIPAGIRLVRKHLGKSRSATSITTGVASLANRSDDTLLEQHDGIQSAILHCKRSFNVGDHSSSKITESGEKSMCSMRKSFGENGSNF